jgi:predicted NAD/FAD-binding protein
MRKLRILLLSLPIVALATTPNAVASLCTDGCHYRFNQAVHACGATYAGDSEAIYLCTQDAQAEYDACMAGC